MAGRGVHFALDGDEQDRHDAATCDEELLAVIEELEEDWERPWVFETDKAWDAIHRALTDGKLEYDNGEPPLNRCILGGLQLHEGHGYVASVTPAEQVAEVARALGEVTREALRSGYDRIDPADYRGHKGDADFEYTWKCFEGLPAFWRQAAQAGRAVLFTVDV